MSRSIVHVVLFKFRPAVSSEHRKIFVEQIQTLRQLKSVQSQRLVVGGPSITQPIEKSKGFDYCLVSIHSDRKALDEYHASEEHERVTSTYFIPFKEDLCRFDFEVEDGQEEFLGLGTLLKRQPEPV